MRASLLAADHELVIISRDQMNKFCGSVVARRRLATRSEPANARRFHDTADHSNVLEVESWQGYKLLVMSTQAYNGFTPEQREVILRHVHRILHADIATIERVGGGGVRCAIAELF